MLLEMGLVSVNSLLLVMVDIFVVYFVMGVGLALSKVNFLAWLKFLDNFSILLMINLASSVVFHVSG